MPRFDVITRVDLPTGAIIECNPTLHGAILRGTVPGEIVKEGDKYVLRARKIVTGHGVGPTGQFPRGKICPEDKGELAIGIATDEEKGVIVIKFGVPMDWFALTSEEAVGLADDLISRANTLDELKKKGQHGT